MLRPRLPVITVLALLALVATACGSGSGATSNTGATATARAAVRDPGAPGPYGVGITKLTFTRPSNADGSPRTLETWVWYPTDAAGGPAAGSALDAAPASSGGPFPLVVFSHGSGGQPQFYRYFTEHLASWGFVVAAPPHPGNTSADCTICDFDNIIASARERPDDVKFVVDQLAALRSDPSSAIGPIVDTSRTAIAGHSFGGWTAVFVAQDERFKAVVSMAPGLPETLLGGAPDVRVPTLLLAGAKDEIVPLDSVRKLYDALPADGDKTLVVMPEGHHLTFVDGCLGCTDALPAARGHELVNRYATAFLETTLLGDERYRPYLEQALPPDTEVTVNAR